MSRAVAIGATVLLLASSTGAVAQERVRAERPPRTLVLEPLVADDDSWDMLVAAPERGEPPAASRGGAPQAAASDERRRESGGEPIVRASLDVDLVTSIVVDRAKRVTMRAVASAIERVGGAAASRTYVYDLIRAATGVLLDRGGLQRANVEQLVLTAVRLVVAEIVVRSRFPDEHMLNRRAYWERTLCGHGRGHRRQSGESLRNCESVRVGFPDESIDPAAIRLYLVDLAYFRLGASVLFGAEDRRLPTCPFDLGTRGSTLCQVLTAGGGDLARDRRIDWALDLRRVERGLAAARTLHGFWREGGGGLRRFLRALVDADEIGAFGETRGLVPGDWSELADLVGKVEELGATTPLLEVTRRIETDGLPDSWAEVEQLRAAVADVYALCQRGGLQCSDVMQWLEKVKALPTRPADPPPTAQSSRARPHGAGGRRATAAEPASPPEVPPVPPQLRPLLQDVQRSIGAFGRSLRIALSVPETEDPLSFTKDRLRMDVELVRARVWGTTARDAFGRRSIGALALSDVMELLHALDRLVVVIRAIGAARAEIPSSVWRWERDVPPGQDGERMQRGRTDVDEMVRALAGTSRVLRLAAATKVHVHADSASTTVNGALRMLDSLATRRAGGGIETPLLDLFEPVLLHIERGRRLEAGVLFRLASEIREPDVLRALGAEDELAAACEIDEEALACWTVRIVQSLREATQIEGARIRVDGAMFRQTLATLGEDFRARTKWRPYFHLTVGLGELGTFVAAPDADPAVEDRLRLQPIVAEQVGFGVASPSFPDDELTFRFGAFLSGILYRLVLDTEESDALIVGAFAALDVYELLEIFVAPLALVFPGDENSTAGIRGGLAIGAQVPLGDYLSEL